jgi:hypothetical protein
MSDTTILTLARMLAELRLQRDDLQRWHTTAEGERATAMQEVVDLRTRLAKAEAELAASKHYTDMFAGVAKMSVKANELHRSITDTLDSGETKPDAVVGVVVDEAMLDRLVGIGNDRVTGSADFWRGRLTAALTSATTVPLASAEVALWRDDSRNYVFGDRERAAQANPTTVTPLYAGITQPTTENTTNA